MGARFSVSLSLSASVPESILNSMCTCFRLRQVSFPSVPLASRQRKPLTGLAAFPAVAGLAKEHFVVLISLAPHTLALHKPSLSLSTL